MKLVNVQEALKGYKKGTFQRVGWKSNIESAAARKKGVSVVKEAEATVRLGISYSNIQAVKVTREENGEFKPHIVWFKHSEDLPFIIEHLQDSDKKYLQLFTVNNNSNPRAYYYINGVLTPKQEVINSGYCNDSTFAQKAPTQTFNIPIENLRFIGEHK